MPPDKFFLDKCRVCGNTLSLYSQRQASNVFKVTTCCKVFGGLHIRCGLKFSTGLNASYNFDALTYENDTSTSLYCFVCRTRCFYCNKKHQVSKNNSQEYFIESCTQCNKWCYTNQKCKGDSDDSLCVECQNITQDNVNLENVLPLPFISPITTECDPKKHTSIHEAISVLLVGKHTSTFQLKNYLKFFNRKLTHLDPKLHNIFSLNRLNTNRVEGLFLSSFSVFKLLEPENEFKVTEELFNFLWIYLIFMVNLIPPQSNAVKS